MSSLNRDAPFPYVTLCGLLVLINVWLMTTWKGVEWAQWYFNAGNNLFTQPKYWFDLVVLFGESRMD
eukprot:SAG11_NODE_6143_length_1379_cov_0.990625_1_plen_67_part_00